MRRSRFTEEQIVRIIQEYAAGAKVSELCRTHGISDELPNSSKSAQGEWKPACGLRRWWLSP